MTVIVLEGPDGVGKTTLADALEAAHPGQILRCSDGPPPTDVPAFDYYAGMVDIDRLLPLDAMVIHDRLHIGELTYAPIMRGRHSLTLAEASVLSMKLDAMGAIQAYCHLSMDKTIRRLIDRDGGRDDEKSGAGLMHIRALRSAFDAMIGVRGRVWGRWRQTCMDAYPDQLAYAVIGAAGIDMGPGWLSPGLGWRSIVVAPPEISWRDIETIELIEDMRLSGTKSAVMLPGDNPGLRLARSGEVQMAAIGDGAAEWLELNDIKCQTVIPERVHRAEALERWRLARWATT